MNTLILKDGKILLKGFDDLEGKIVYFALYISGVVILKEIINEQDYYYKAKIENKQINDEILYELLNKRGITKSDFIYIPPRKGYFQLEPTAQK